MTAQAKRELSPAEIVTGLKLLELQRYLMLMYTSCGWFFDEVSGIETVQVIQYAGRALQLAGQLFAGDLSTPFLDLLAQARSNLPEQGDGRSIYQRYVQPAMVDLHKVGAHYAVSSVFEEYGPNTRIYCYDVARMEYRTSRQGKLRAVLGQASVTSEITWESEQITFGVLHLADHSVIGGVRQFQGDEAYRNLDLELDKALAGGDLAELVRLMEKNFSSGTYTLRLLFRDEQRKILGIILEEATNQARALYRNFHDEHAHLIRFVTDLGVPLPRRFRLAVDFTLNSDLLDAFSVEEVDLNKSREILEEIRRTGVTPDAVTLEFALRRTIERLFTRFVAHPTEPGLLARLQETIAAGPRPAVPGASVGGAKCLLPHDARSRRRSKRASRTGRRRSSGVAGGIRKAGRTIEGKSADQRGGRCVVILSGVAASLREAAAQSKDPYDVAIPSWFPSPSCRLQPRRSYRGPSTPPAHSHRDGLAALRMTLLLSTVSASNPLKVRHPERSGGFASRSRRAVEGSLMPWHILAVPLSTPRLQPYGKLIGVLRSADNAFRKASALAALRMNIAAECA